MTTEIETETETEIQTAEGDTEIEELEASDADIIIQIARKALAEPSAFCADEILEFLELSGREELIKSALAEIEIEGDLDDDDDDDDELDDPDASTDIDGEISY